MTDNLVILRFAEARQPEYRERKGQGYIEFGELNDYPDYLLSLFNKSAKHNAIVKGKVNYITGNGWKAAEGDLAADAFIKQPNAYESLPELTRKVSLDIEIFGGAYLEIIWSKVGGNLTSVSHIDYMKVRTTKDNTSFFVKDDWMDRRVKPDVIPAFNAKQREGRQILYVKEYRPGLDAYALPGYLGSLNYIESDIEVSKHVLGNAQTGFSASKLITLPNGEPSPDEKRVIDNRFRDNFSGADGKKFMLSFVTSIDRKPVIDDLGASDLTKEDFGRVDTMIQQNIFAGHQLTSPSLFGIAEPGKLGSRNELRDAYEIFKNTYVTDKQAHLEQVFSRLARIKGAQEDITIVPVEPITYELSEASIMTVAPREWILEKAGIDVSKYQDTAPAAGANGEPISSPQGQPETVPVNENLKNLTGRQWQQVLRIVRQYGQGKITREIAATMLISGYGMNDGEVMSMLGETEEMSEDWTEEMVADLFAECGEPREAFDVVKSGPLKFEDEVTDEVGKGILSILRKQPLTPAADIAKALKRGQEEIEARIRELIDTKVLIVSDKGEIKPARPLREIVDEPVKTEFEIRYSYEWRSVVPVSQRDPRTSRPFCQRLMQLDRFYTRKEIELISQRLGYSVFDRAGGWWTSPINPNPPQCRHEWRSNVLIKRPKK